MMQISARHLDLIRSIHKTFGQDPFLFCEAKDNGIAIHGATLGTMHKGGALERVGFRQGTYYAHKWRISEKAMMAMERRGY